MTASHVEGGEFLEVVSDAGNKKQISLSGVRRNGISYTSLIPGCTLDSYFLKRMCTVPSGHYFATTITPKQRKYPSVLMQSMYPPSACPALNPLCNKISNQHQARQPYLLLQISPCLNQKNVQTLQEIKNKRNVQHTTNIPKQ
jgi:hypothetical protein